MTKFTKENILADGMYVYYAKDGIHTPWQERKFIARFKHCGPVTKGKFIKSLMKNYTVEDYFAKMEAGDPPLRILEKDGHLTFQYGENGGRNYFVLDGKVL